MCTYANTQTHAYTRPTLSSNTHHLSQKKKKNGAFQKKKKMAPFKRKKKSQREEARLQKAREYHRNAPIQHCTCCLYTTRRTSHMKKHLRTQHGELLPIKKRTRKPYKFGKCTAFLRKMVFRHVQQDKEKNRFNEQYPEPTNEQQDEIIKDILKRLGVRYKKSIDNQQCRDDYGGVLPKGFNFHFHGGVHNISCDRIDNNHIPHYFFVNNTWLSNIKITVTMMNHKTNTTRNMILEEIERQKTWTPSTVLSMQQELLEWWEGSASYQENGKKYTKIVYSSIYNAWKREQQNELFKKQFCTFKNFFEYCIALLKKQNCQSALSGILMWQTQKNSDAGTRSFAPSLDAIDPQKGGHVKGNLRWVCSYENIINHDKEKKKNYSDDSPSILTTEILSTYLDVDLPIVF